MKNILLCIVIIVSLLTSCQKNNKEDEKKTFTYFNTELTSGMDYNALINKFGQPDEDRGSGIHIYVYKLSDGTEIWIGYTDKIMYARHVNASGQILHTLI